MKPVELEICQTDISKEVISRKPVPEPISRYQITVLKANHIIFYNLESFRLSSYLGKIELDIEIALEVLNSNVFDLAKLTGDKFTITIMDNQENTNTIFGDMTLENFGFDQRGPERPRAVQYHTLRFRQTEDKCFERIAKEQAERPKADPTQYAEPMNGGG